MSSNFAFKPMGLSQAVACGSAAVTTSLRLVQLGGVTATVGASGATAYYTPGGVRLVNLGTTGVYIQFGAGGTVTVSTGTGMYMLANTVETFNVYGHDRFAAICAAGTTTTLLLTAGEGL